ncbi:MAG: LegC family aminotransferase [Micrococcales bacterium]
MNALANEFVERLRSVIGTPAPGAPFGLHEPEIGDLEKKYINECLDSTFVSSVGAFIPQFEQRIAEITGAKYAIAVSNGTVGLQVALFLAGVRPGDEVIVPTLSFIATANAVSHAGAIPHFIDSELSTLGMSPEALRDRLAAMRRDADGTLRNPLTGARIAAISPMHTLGHPVRIEEICDVAAEFDVPVVEDAAESLGSFVTTRSGVRKHTGTFGITGMISFNGNKTITTGGGGVIVTDDDELGPLAKHLTTTAKLPHKWEFEHDHIAWNFRMPNLNAALGMAQLEKFDRFLEQKRRLAIAYGEAFAGFEGARFSFEPEGTESNYWLCAVQLDEPSLALRDEVLQACHDAGFLARPMWNLLHQQRMYSSAPAAGDSLGGSLDTAIALHASLICIPSTPKLAERLV